MSNEHPSTARRFCFHCGDPTEEYDYLGSRKVGLCGKRECGRELSRDNRALDEEARMEAEEDGYSRYHQ